MVVVSISRKQHPHRACSGAWGLRGQLLFAGNLGFGGAGADAAGFAVNDGRRGSAGSSGTGSSSPSLPLLCSGGWPRAGSGSTDREGKLGLSLDPAQGGMLSWV